MTFLYLTVHLQGKRAILFDWKRKYPLQFISAILFAEVLGVSETRVRKGREKEDHVWLFWNFLFYLLFFSFPLHHSSVQPGAPLEQEGKQERIKRETVARGIQQFLAHYTWSAIYDVLKTCSSPPTPFFLHALELKVCISKAKVWIIYSRHCRRIARNCRSESKGKCVWYSFSVGLKERLAIIYWECQKVAANGIIIYI